MRFHLLGYVHLPVSEKYTGCAFTQKVVKLDKMLRSLGHTTILYGCEGSDDLGTEFVQTHTLRELKQTWGDGDNRFDLGYDFRDGQFRHDLNAPRTPLTLKFYGNCIIEISKRKQPDDFLLVMQGYYHKPIADAVNLWLTVEPGIGYRGSYCRFRAFESAFMMNYTYGAENPDKACINGHYYDRVIPNYYDLKDFPFQPKKDDLFLFIGRMIIRKGVWTAVEATRAVGTKLYLAGQQDPEIDIKSLPSHCEFIGYLDAEQRAYWMGRAKAVFVPTQYLEIFGGVNVESQLCGTGVITTNFGCFVETVLQGVTGFRCDTLQDFVDATKKIEKLNPATIREIAASRYDMEVVKYQYQKYFEELYQLYLSAVEPGVKAWSLVTAPHD